MKKLLPYIAILITSGFMLLAPMVTAEAQGGGQAEEMVTTEAQGGGPAAEMMKGADTTGTQGGQDVNQIIQTVVNVLFFILGALAVIMIIWSGIRYVTSAGNATAVTSAKNTLIYSVVGLIVAMLAYAIVSFIVDALG